METLTVLSLFDGMSCGQIALRELCVPIERYYASEIDKHAIAQTQLNFPDTIQLGDVEQWRTWDIDWESVDLLLAGSPCQGFSLAGKMLGHGDPRSRLYWVFLEILRHVQAVNPSVKYLLENVRMRPSRRPAPRRSPQDASSKRKASCWRCRPRSTRQTPYSPQQALGRSTSRRCTR